MNYETDINVLMLHNRYINPGGEDVSTDGEVHLLKNYGQKIMLYELHNRNTSRLPLVKVGLKAIWSWSAFREVRNQIRTGRHTVVHVQNFFPLLSPAVYYAARVEGIPVVQTLRNFRLLCPNALLFRSGRVCEDCVGHILHWPGLFHKCYRGSRSATGAVVAMLTFHHLLGTWSRMVDIYIALTEFTRQKYINGGFPAEKIIVKPNFVYPDPGPSQSNGTFALFVGRLSPEKGVHTLIKAWERLSIRVPLKIIGNGPLNQSIHKITKIFPWVEWLGWRSTKEVYSLMGNAAFLVFPSEWYETFGRVAIEAYAKGTPVISSDIGAMAEIVENNRTGLLFQSGNPDDLAAKVEWAWTHPKEMAEMGREARKEYEAKYTAEKNYEMLMEIYRIATDIARSRV